MNDQLPNAKDAEAYLIGSTLLDGHIPAAARDLAVTDFYNPHYRHAWRAFLEIDQDGVEIDAATAAEIMLRNGSTFTLIELVDTTKGMLHRIDAFPLVRCIKDSASRRHLSRELLSQADALRTEPTVEVVHRLRAKLDDYDALSSSIGRFRHIGEILENDVEPALYALNEGKTEDPSVAKIRTGFPSIDHLIGGGISVSDVLLIAGLPGSGKSAFALQMAENIASAGVPLGFISGEMSDKENSLRLLSQVSRMTNLNAVESITTDELTNLKGWCRYLKTQPLYFDCKTLDTSAISRSIGGLVSQHNVRVLVIDYVQLLRLDRRETRQSRYERISEVSQEVKRMAMEHDVAIIEVAQFNRVGLTSRRPTMHDLEGSSQLEKDASLVFIIDHDQRTGDITLRMEKGRNSGVCEIRGRFIGRTLTFEF